MDITILISLAAFIFVLLVGLTLFLRKSNPPEQAEVRARGLPNRAREGVPRRVQAARNRGARQRVHVAAPEAPQHSDHEDAQVADESEVIDSKVGAKKKAKLEAKAEKKREREAEERIRQEKRQKEQSEAEERRKASELEAAEEERREEEQRKAKEERERREHEEYLQMKQAFAVEEEGFEEGDDANDLNLLQQFVEYIKANKVVVIEDLAAHFKLKTQATIDRIRDLQKDNILTGVIDDRGKFIYISQVELEAVARFIRQRGRISVTELAENSNKLINLTTVQS